LLIGLPPLGAEIAKNCILNGIGRLDTFDESPITELDRY
jgi:molybdopterin/thiamine biosynthesis adenylyltransferase